MSQDTEREALEAAWRECRDACDPSDWKTSEAAAYRGFFAHGYRAALASQPPAAQGEIVAWALMTNGKPNAPRGRTLSWEPPCNESLQIAAIEGESWVPLFASPPSREPQWQPIETAPKDGTLLLLWCKTPPDRKYASPDTNFCIGSYDDNGGAFANDDDWYSIESHEDVWGMGSEMTGPLTETARVKCEPTHWMPLPPPPGIHSREGGSNG